MTFTTSALKLAQFLPKEWSDGTRSTLQEGTVHGEHTHQSVSTVGMTHCRVVVLSLCTGTHERGVRGLPHLLEQG